MIRELYLINQSGERYSFNEQSRTLAKDLTGLGFEKSIEYLKYNDEFKKGKEENPKSRISFKLIFLDGYNGYSSFLNYLKRSDELKLYYKSNDLKFCNIEIVSLSKGELNSFCIESTINIERLSLWKKITVYQIEAMPHENNKSYPFKYPYVYSQFNDGKIVITNNGVKKSSMRIEITGSIDNPEIVVLKNEQIFTKLKFYIKKSNCQLIIDANVTNQEMTLIDEDGVHDAYQYQDFTCDNFIFIDNGTYTIEFNPGVSEQTKCKIYLTEVYLGN